MSKNNNDNNDNNDNVEENQATEEGAAEEAELEASENVEAQAKVAEYLAGWQRERAEFANYRKRVERERAALYQNAKLDVLNPFLSVFDDFERALANIPEDAEVGEAGDWAQGVAMIHRKMHSIMESLGVAEIEALGQPFDPKVHEAVGQGEGGEYESDHVMDVLQKGYRHGDRVLRPAMVRVAL